MSVWVKVVLTATETVMVEMASDYDSPDFDRAQDAAREASNLTWCSDIESTADLIENTDAIEREKAHADFVARLV